MAGLIVHEWLEPRGGAERVVDAMRATFPDAGLVALWNDAPEKYRDVRESWLSRTPLRRHKALALPFLPTTWRHVIPRRDDLDWVLVSSHLFAHHVDVRTRSGERVPKYVYVHTPARYIWEPELDERGQSIPVRAVATVLKPLDRKRAQEAVALAANSEFVRERIRNAWHRDATVIYPPVDVEGIQSVTDWRTRLTGEENKVLDSLPDQFILGASRFVPYKRLDWVIRAGSAVKTAVVIAGGGPEESNLRAVAAEAKVPVYFISSPSTPLLYALYQSASLYVFPAIEDFGIMPVEAQAAGCPVVTTSIGGATESLTPGVTGVSAVTDDVHALADAVRVGLAIPHFAPQRKDAHRTERTLGSSRKVAQFSASAFRNSLHTWMGSEKVSD